jgi:hypothetical protein
MFGNNIDKDGFQRETTPMNPVSVLMVVQKFLVIIFVEIIEILMGCLFLEWYII